MKTIETQEQAFELLNKVKILFEKECKNQPNELILLKQIRSFLSKNDSQSDVDRDCRNYLDSRKDDLKIHIMSDFNFEKKCNNELPDFKFCPPPPEQEECPMNNFKDRMRKTYPEIFKLLDFNFLNTENSILSIYEEFSNAFKKHNILIFMFKNEQKDVYQPYINHNGIKHNIEGNYEFEQTAQMACIEKCFEIIDELGLHLQSVTLLEKFEDWYEVRELDHLQNGTEFKPLEIYNYFKPYIDFSKYRKKY